MENNNSDKENDYNDDMNENVDLEQERFINFNSIICQKKNEHSNPKKFEVDNNKFKNDITDVNTITPPENLFSEQSFYKNKNSLKNSEKTINEDMNEGLDKNSILLVNKDNNITLINNLNELIKGNENKKEIIQTITEEHKKEKKIDNKDNNENDNNKINKIIEDTNKSENNEISNTIIINETDDLKKSEIIENKEYDDIEDTEKIKVNKIRIYEIAEKVNNDKNKTKEQINNSVKNNEINENNENNDNKEKIINEKDEINNKINQNSSISEENNENKIGSNSLKNSIQMTTKIRENFSINNKDYIDNISHSSKDKPNVFNPNYINSIKNPDNKVESKSKLTLISNDIIKSIFGNKTNYYPNMSLNNINYDDIFFLQSKSPTDKENKINSKIITNFILRNNYPKNNNNMDNYSINNNNQFDLVHSHKKNDKTNSDIINNINDTNFIIGNQNNNYTSNINISNNYITNNISNKEYSIEKKNSSSDTNSKIIKPTKKNYSLENFLYREKQFELKRKIKRENLLLKEEKKEFEKCKKKPSICKKSSGMSERYSNIKNKAYERLYDYQNVLDEDLKSFFLRNRLMQIKRNNAELEQENMFFNNENYLLKNQLKDKINKAKSPSNNRNLNAKTMLELLKDTNTKSKNKTKINFYKNNNNNSNKKIITKSQSMSNIYNSDNKYKNYVKKRKIEESKDAPTATEKMKIILINKFNQEIDSFSYKMKNINFATFKNLLYDLGFCYTKSKNENNDVIDINKIKIQPYFQKSKLNQEFINNERKIIQEAFNCILNNFQIDPNENNENKDFLSKNISLRNLKLFLFILSNYYIGKEFSRNNNLNNKIINRPNSLKRLIKNNSTTNINNKSKCTNISSPYSFQSFVPKYISNNNNLMDEKLKNFQSENINNLIERLTGTKNKLTKKYLNNLKQKFIYMINIRNIHINYYTNKKKSEKKSEIFKDKNCTFIPTINKNNELKMININPSMNFEERTEMLIDKKYKNEKNLIKKISNEYNKLCTFSPKINKTINFNSLYKTDYCPKKKLQINTITEKAEDDNEDNEYSFSPKLNKSINRRMFYESPLSNDKLFNEKISKMRIANFNKKLKNYINKHRELISGKIKNNEQLLTYLIDNEKDGSLKYGLEKNNNKLGFEVFNNDPPDDGFMNDANNIINTKKKIPLFNIEVKTNKINRILNIYENENYEDVCYNFCKKYSLGSNSYNAMLNTIYTKLNELNEINETEEIKNTNSENNNINNDI